MANIVYTSNNNTCSNSNNGSIHINQINFDNDTESNSFLSYSIQWSGSNLSPSQISSDHRSIEQLSSGLYSFSLYSLIDSSIIGPYDIQISSPEPLSIVSCKHSDSSCNTNDGVVDVVVSGGTPPYSVLCGTQRVTSSDNIISLSNINSGDYILKIIDNNDCSVVYDKTLKIHNRTLSANILEITPPTLLDSYGIVKVRVGGEGPFNLEFINNDTKEIINIDYTSSSKYITNKIDDKYYYRIDDKVTPGSYLLKITNKTDCLFTISFVMKNIEPIKIDCYPERFYQPIPYSQHLTSPILDTILIPFYHIKNNTDLWQFIKNLKLKDRVCIKTNDSPIQYAIVRNISKVDNDQIEVLRLGPNSKDWFFYFHIAPGININNINDLLLEYKLTNNDKEYSLNIGISDTNDPSLVKGSFILNGTGFNQFCNTNNDVYINAGITSEFDNYTYSLTSSSKNIFKTLYDIGNVTVISFLSDKMFNHKVSTKDISCVVSEDENSHLQNIYNILYYINDSNNIFNIYIYNSNTPPHLNSLRLNIRGNDFLSLENKEKIQNEYDISYLLFTESSITPKTITKENKNYKRNLLNNIKDGYIIIKLQDLYNNKTKIINYNNLSINYDNHFTEASNLINITNKNMASYFNYGDILVYIGPQDIPVNIPHNIVKET